jgi:hypothetical protein
MAVAPAKLGEGGVADADNGLEQHARHDCEPIAHLLGFAKRNVRRFATPNHVEQARTVHKTRHRGDLFQGLRSLYKRHVSTNCQNRICTANGFFESKHCSAISARHDEEVRVASCGKRCPDLRKVFVNGNDQLIVKVAALLWEALVFDMNASDASLLIFSHSPRCVELVAISGIGVGNDRRIHRGGDAAGIFGHFGHCNEPIVRIPQRCRRAGADPAGMRPFVANWPQTARGLLGRVYREALGRVIDERRKALLAELSQYPGVKPEWRAPSPGDALPMVPLTFVKDGVTLNYFSMIATVGTPQTVTAEELRLECMFPADDATESRHSRFVQANSATGSSHN